MGMSDEAVMTDKLGRRSGPRRRYTLDEKRAVVAETQVLRHSYPSLKRLCLFGNLPDSALTTPPTLPTNHSG
jgi:hypothetical protein